MTTETSEKILRSIRQARISPVPRWKFVVKNLAFWILFGGALLVGALSFSVIISLLADHDWDIYTYLHKSFFQYLLLSLPYLWIACVMIFAWLTQYYFVHTRGWYRHRRYRVMSAAIMLSIGLGMAFFALGFGKKIDRTLASKIPYYEAVNLDKDKLWNHPDDGLLGGEVIKIFSDSNAFVIKDYSGNEWDVEKASAKIENTTVAVGEKVKLIGKEKKRQASETKESKQGEAPTVKEKSQPVFEAEEIRQAEPRVEEKKNDDTPTRVASEKEDQRQSEDGHDDEQEGGKYSAGDERED